MERAAVIAMGVIAAAALIQAVALVVAAVAAFRVTRRLGVLRDEVAPHTAEIKRHLARTSAEIAALSAVMAQEARTTREAIETVREETERLAETLQQGVRIVSSAFAWLAPVVRAAALGAQAYHTVRRSRGGRWDTAIGRGLALYQAATRVS